MTGGQCNEQCKFLPGKRYSASGFKMGEQSVYCSTCRVFYPINEEYLFIVSRRKSCPCCHQPTRNKPRGRRRSQIQYVLELAGKIKRY